MRAYQQERLRLLEMYGESESRLHELLSLFEEMLLQGNSSGGSGGSGRSRGIGGSSVAKVLTATGTKVSSSPSSSLKSPLKSQPFDDDNDNECDNDNDNDIINDSRDSQRSRNTTSTSASPSTPTSPSASIHVGGSSWVNQTVITTERRDAEARMSAVRSLLGLDENDHRQGLVDQGQGLDDEGQGLDDKRQFRELLETGTERYAHLDESTPTDDNHHDHDMDKNKGSKEGEGKRKGRAGVSRWLDATVQVITTQSIKQADQTQI